MMNQCTRVIVGLTVLAAALLLYSPEDGLCQHLRDDLFGVSFVSDQAGWVCGRWGALFATADGGQTWRRQESGTDQTLSAVSFADPENGWAVGDEGTILHTADGGKTWQKQKSPVPYFLLDVQFVSSLKGWIVTERTTILVTSDGGATWEVQFRAEDFLLKAISFCDELNGWAVGEYGFIYHTADGGATWEHQAGEFGFSEETGEIEGGTYLFDVAAIDAQTAWVAGIDSFLMKTSDAGKTWEPVRIGIPTTHLFGIAADTRNCLLVCGSGVLALSGDGGQSFDLRKNDPVITYGWLNGAAAVGARQFVAVGREGMIYQTRDAGGSWTSVVAQ